MPKIRTPTGRLVEDKPELQNLPMHTAEAKAIRQAFTGETTSLILIDDPMAPPLPHVQRMIDEEVELHERHRALSTFLSLNPVAKTLSKTDLKLMLRQRKAMATYLDVLNERIRRAI